MSSHMHGSACGEGSTPRASGVWRPIRDDPRRSHDTAAGAGTAAETPSTTIRSTRAEGRAERCRPPDHHPAAARRARARERWTRALRHAARRARLRKARRLTLSMMYLYTAGTVPCVVTAALIWLAEDESLIAQAEGRMNFAGDIGGDVFLAFTGALYVLELVRFRVGYGDVIIKTTAGRAACMIGSCLTIPFTTAFVFRFTELMEFIIRLSVTPLLKKRRACRWQDHIFICYYLAVIAIHTTVWGLFIGIDHAKDDVYTPTDILWFIWASITSVGYGDIDVATIARNSLWRFAVHYVFAVFGLCLIEGLLARCCILMLAKLR